jgi:hypothetical protein
MKSDYITVFSISGPSNPLPQRMLEKRSVALAASQMGGLVVGRYLRLSSLFYHSHDPFNFFLSS